MAAAPRRAPTESWPMRVEIYPSSEVDEQPPQVGVATATAPRWGLLYAVEDFPVEKLIERYRKAFPQALLFGATSFRGVFTGRQLFRGAALLLADDEDDLDCATALRTVAATHGRAAAESAAREVAAALGRAPEIVVLHATPGFEEELLRGIVAALGPNVEVYGGSAADDQIAGRWKAFSTEGVTQEGFVLAGLSARPRKAWLRGGFLSGYLPTAKHGTVTQASGRVISQIDGEAAAVVYNRWTGGLLGHRLREGGNVLLDTNRHPLGRIIESNGAVPQRLLSHPHEVFPDGSLGLFTEISVGDKIELMIGTPEPLVARTGKVVSRALGRNSDPMTGGLLVYCGGCLAALSDRGNDIAAAFDHAVGGAPYIGVATFGEQGCFPIGRSKMNRHGNLMCSAVLFGRRGQ